MYLIVNPKKSEVLIFSHGKNCKFPDLYFGDIYLDVSFIYADFGVPCTHLQKLLLDGHCKASTKSSQESMHC